MSGQGGPPGARASRLVALGRVRAARAGALAGVAASPGGLRSMRRVRPFSIAAFRLVEAIGAEVPAFATVVDVGANAGQFSAAALARWPGADVVAFEPLPRAAALLRVALARFPRAEVHQVALGASAGTVALHPHRYSPSSSVLPVAPDVRGRYAWTEEEPALDVPLCRLDEVLAGRELAGPVLLKLDVQGYELEVLAGATEVLGQVDRLVLELAFERFYEGQPLFSEANRWLEVRGWHLARPLDWRQEQGRVVEIDCLYRRRG